MDPNYKKNGGEMAHIALVILKYMCVYIYFIFNSWFIADDNFVQCIFWTINNIFSNIGLR